MQVMYAVLRDEKLQDAQLSQRDRAARCVSFWPKVEDWNWETIFTDITGLYSTIVM